MAHHQAIIGGNEFKNISERQNSKEILRYEKGNNEMPNLLP